MNANSRRRRAVKRWIVWSGVAVLAGIMGISGYWISEARKRQLPPMSPGVFSYGVKSESVEAVAVGGFANVDKDTGLPAHQDAAAPTPPSFGSPAAAPEPASLMLLAPGALFLIRRRRGA